MQRRLARGYVGRQEADDMGGGEGEDESQIWFKVKRLDPYQGEHAADLSPLSHIRLLSDFDLCSGNVQSVGKRMIWHLFISKQRSAVRAITSDRPYSRQLKETPCVVGGASCCLRSLPSAWLGSLQVCELDPRVGYGWPPRTGTGQLVHKMADCKSPAGRVWQGHPEVSSTTRN